MKNSPLLNLTLALVLVLIVGYLLEIGQPILVPVVTAVIAIYVMMTMADALQKLPLLKLLPPTLLRACALVVFVLALYAFAAVVASTVTDMVNAAPAYQENIAHFLATIEEQFHIDTSGFKDNFIASTFGNWSVRSVILTVLGGFTSIGASAFLIVLYATFLMAERSRFSHRIAAALGNRGQADKVEDIIRDINQQIGTYLTIKTLINIILGGVSYVILIFLQVDFALFWAIMIALLNYIPYFGSLLAVLFPVILSVAQTGSLLHTALLAALLVGAQVYVGNFLEPRLVGRQLNLSPFVIVVALSIWSALWGIPGAILAVPMTSVIAIVLASFDETRFIAILLSNRVGGDDDEDA